MRICFQDIFLQLQWHGNGCGCGSSYDLANFSNVSKSRVGDDTDLAHFIDGLDELSVEKEIRRGDLVALGTSCWISSNFVVDAEQSSLQSHVPEVAQVPSKLWLEVQRHFGVHPWVWEVTYVGTNVAEEIGVSRVQVGIRQPRAQKVVETIQEAQALRKTYGVCSCKNS